MTWPGHTLVCPGHVILSTAKNRAPLIAVGTSWKSSHVSLGSDNPCTGIIRYCRQGSYPILAVKLYFPKNVPAEVCQACGEAYLEAATTRHLLHILEEAARVGVQVDVRSYAAA